MAYMIKSDIDLDERKKPLACTYQDLKPFAHSIHWQAREPCKHTPNQAGLPSHLTN